MSGKQRVGARSRPATVAVAAALAGLAAPLAPAVAVGASSTSRPVSTTTASSTASTVRASTATGAVVSPKPGQQVTRSLFQVVVRAGREHSDLQARLNGVTITTQFRRGAGNTRRLRVSSSDGLRHGRNVLRVTARVGTKKKTSTVRFTVAHRKPIVGAGHDRRTVSGSAIRLNGRLVTHATAAKPSTVRWRVLEAPRGSRLRGAGKAKAKARATAVQSPTAVNPTFRPDKPGSYKLRISAGAGKALVSDTVTVHASPRSAAIEIDTAVDGADPAGTKSVNAAAGRSGIRVGTTVYRAPWMRVADGKGTSSGTVDTMAFGATWQVLVLDRKTLTLEWNRTYGRCTTPGAGGLRDVSCRRGDNGKPFMVDMDKELAALGDDQLVIAASHTSRSADRAGGQWWDLPAEPGGNRSALIRVGLSTEKAFAGIEPGSAAVVGVGDLEAGHAKWIRRTDGRRAELAGFLVADINGHYGFVSSGRTSFDTRSESGCDGATCVSALLVDGKRTSVQGASDARGYLVAVHDEVTLRRTGAYVVGIPSNSLDAGASTLASTLTTKVPVGSLVVVSSYGGAWNTGQRFGRQASAAAANAIASVGGTKHEFNTSTLGPDGGYSLIGWSGAGEGNGIETAHGTGRLRGALMQDAESRYRPANVSADGAPAERLQRLLTAPRTTAWPLDDQPGPRAALSWIGTQIPQLGGDPRQAYWLQDVTTLKTAGRALERIDAPGGQSFSTADFATAKKQLGIELGWVETTRDYLDLLARPSGTAGKTVWEEATVLQDRMEAEVKIAGEHAEANEMWFGIVRSLLEAAGGLAGMGGASELFGHLVEVTSAAVEGAKIGWESSHSGEEEIEEDTRVKVNELAATLERQAAHTTEAFWRMGNAIVSDPKKLQEVGTWASCLPGASSGGCAKGYEEYAVTPTDTAKSTRAARMALERQLYEEIVPLSFSVWDTGLSRDPEPARTFSCVGGAALQSPFTDEMPAATVARSLDEAGAPGPGGDANDRNTGTRRWRTSLLVRRDKMTYSYPSASVLQRMFGPVTASEESSGLGIVPHEMMRAAKERYEPGATCVWLVPGSVHDPEPQ